MKGKISSNISTGKKYSTTGQHIITVTGDNVKEDYAMKNEYTYTMLNYVFLCFRKNNVYASTDLFCVF